MAEQSSNSEFVAELAEEFVERYRKGERPQLSEYVGKHPELADEIKDLFPALVMLEGLAPEHDASIVGAEPESAPQTPMVEQLGDYRILREVGRGGMGIVYEAEQVSLGRHVALKVLPQNLLTDDQQKRRFEREAKAAARLHHTNIVPVFGVGEHDGMHYYVMQFIQGLGLHEVLFELQRMQKNAASRTPAAELELPVQRRAEIAAAEVARSLLTGAFHERQFTDAPDSVAAQARLQPTETGVVPSPSVERVSRADTRTGDSSSGRVAHSGSIALPGQSPSEITSSSQAKKLSYWQSVATMGVQVASALQHAHDQGIQHRDIKPSNLLLDMRGTVWVTDFGLAKSDDQQNLTHTGDILGTLRYLPPEAFAGKADHRGDVYSLGLSLYEMLALKPAFQERDRNKLIKQVTQEAPPRLDKLSREIPRDLVTIVHKAIERDPDHRYQSGGELAEDLQRFIDDEPIKARRVSLAERFARWARHNRGLAVSLSTVASLVLIIAVGAVLAADYFRSLADANAKLAAEKATALRRESSQRKEMETTLYQSVVNEANALRLARKPGYRKRVFELLQQAMAIDTPAKDLSRLRQEAVACMGDFIANEPIVWQGLGDLTNKLALFPDSRRVALLVRTTDTKGGSRARISIRSIPTSRETGTFELGLSERIDGLAVTTDGKVVACDRSGLVEVWQQDDAGQWQRANRRTLPRLSGSRGKDPDPLFPDGRQSVLLSGPPREVQLRLFPDGSRCLLCRLGSREFTIRGLTDPSLDRSMPVPSGGLLHPPAISPDGRLLAAALRTGADLTIGIWNVATGKLERRITTPFITSFETAFTPDGRSLICGASGSFATYDVKTFQQLSLVKRSWAHSMSFTPDSQIMAFATFARKIRIWNLSSQREIAAIDHANLRYVDVVRITLDGTWLLATSPNEVRLWRLRGLPEKLTLAGHQKMVPCNAFSPDGKLLATGSKDGTVQLWDVRTGDLLHTISPGYVPQSLDFSRDGRLLAVGSWYGTETKHQVTLWDVKSRRLVAGQKVHDRTALRVAFTSDGRQLVVCGTGLTVFDVVRNPPSANADGRIELKQRDYVSGTGSLAMALSSDDQTVAFVDRVRFLRTWDLKNRKENDVFPNRKLLIHGWYNVTFLPDNRHVAFIAQNGKPQVWDARTGEMAFEIAEAPQFQSCQHALSPNGRWLAGDASADALTIVDLKTRKFLFSLPEEGAPIKSVSWSPDGQQIAVGLLDGRVAIWNLAEIRKQLAAVGLSWN